VVGAVAAALAAATTWTAALSWRDFTVEPGRYLGPLAVLAVVVAGLGVLLRVRRVPAAWVVLSQVVISGLVGAWLISGRLLPFGEGWVSLQVAFSDAATSTTAFAAPVPADAPGVHPFFVLGGLGCLLVVDVIVATLRRAPLAGLPLLAVYSVPVGMLGTGLEWWVFVLPAAGYLALLFLDQGDRVQRWGQSLAALDDPAGPGARPTAPAAGASAGRIGAGVLVLAVLLPLLIPTLSVQVFDGAGSGTGDGDVTVVNPSVNLLRDLVRPQDVPLTQVVTDDPDPSYLRIAVLNRFSANSFSPGDRDIPGSQRVDGALPDLEGVGSTIPRTPYRYDLSAVDRFESRWLPTPAQATAIQADGDWRYDTSTRDVIASGDDLTTAGLEWSVEAAELDLDATTLAESPAGVGLVSSELTDLPEDIAPVVAQLTEEVTVAAPTRFEKAVALQNWFRDSGNFTYSLDVDLGTGADDLARFLSPGDGGRVGYCEQFASAMTVMSRQLGIPARVAVGFLRAQEIEPGTWQFSSHDLHAWPELFFPGSGWVRFEPTPPTRANGVPGYTTEGVTPDDPTVAPQNPSAAPEAVPSQQPAAPEVAPADAADDTTGGRQSWRAAVVVLLVVGLLAALLALPGVVRRRRSERRRHGGIEAAWAELHDTAVDLRVDWPTDRSPRETAAALSPRLTRPGSDPESDAASVHGSAPGSDPEAAAALARIVGQLERHRFADVPSRGGPGATADHDSLRRDLDRCVRALQMTAAPADRRRATLLPASVLRRRRGSVSGPVGGSMSDSMADSRSNTAGDRLQERV